VPSAAVFTTGELAALLGGELIGSPDIRIAGVGPLDEAGPGDLSFLASASYLPYFQASTAAAAVVSRPLANAPGGPATRIIVPDARAAVARILDLLVPPVPWGIAPTARIGHGVRWEGRIAIEAGAVIGDGVRLGRDCRIGEHAVLEHGTTLGDRVVIKAGARLGTRGFGFVGRDDGPDWSPVAHAGGCRIGDDVEIGANSTVDRGSVGTTAIGPGTKIDNLVHIGHNVRIGARCRVMAQVGIAGSTVLGDDVIVAGQAGLADHLRVGSGARIAAQSGVIGDVPAGATVSGYPARDHRAVLRQTAALQRLAPLVTHLEKLIPPHGHSA